MRVPKQFNVAPFAQSPDTPAWFRAFVDRHVQQLKRLAESITGPALFAFPNPLGVAQTVTLGLGDLVQATLGANTTLTIALDQRAGAEGLLELAQDATGGRTVAWVNVLWAGGAPPVVAATALKRTLVGFTHRGDAWVGRVIASSY